MIRARQRSNRRRFVRSGRTAQRREHVCRLWFIQSRDGPENQQKVVRNWMTDHSLVTGFTMFIRRSFDMTCFGISTYHRHEPPLQPTSTKTPLTAHGTQARAEVTPPLEKVLLINWLRSSVGRYRHVGHTGGVCGLVRPSAAPSQVDGRSWERPFQRRDAKCVTLGISEVA